MTSLEDKFLPIQQKVYYLINLNEGNSTRQGKIKNYLHILQDVQVLDHFYIRYLPNIENPMIINVELHSNGRYYSFKINWPKPVDFNHSWIQEGF